MSFQFHIIFTAQNKAPANNGLLVADKLTLVKRPRTVVSTSREHLALSSKYLLTGLPTGLFRDKVFNPS